MADQSGPYRWVITLGYVAVITSLVLLGLGAASWAALATVLLMGGSSWQTVIAAGLSALAMLVAALWAVVGYGVIRLIHANEAGVQRSVGRLSRIETLIHAQTESIQELAPAVAMSDRAKSVIYHEQELVAIRDAFPDALIRQTYEAAEGLIPRIAENPSYASEADRMRAELVKSRKATESEKIDAAIERIGQILGQMDLAPKDWARAEQATRRMLQMYPENPKVAGLPERIQVARTKHKRSLLQAYNEAVMKNDVDSGIALLQSLDQYLTAQEAAAMEESARGVFRAKLHNLGVQFALCVTDERWEQAVTVGEQIVAEYPNSRMAQEVREKMDRLRTLATAPDQQPDT